MTRRRSILFFLSAAGLGASAATTPGEPKDVALRRKATGTVTAVDPAARRLRLKGARGEAGYLVDARVQNLEEVHPGDRVRVDYVAALVVTLKRSGPELSAPRSPAASEGSPVPVGTTEVMKVLAVDRGTRNVRLQGPRGRSADFRVQDPADLVGVRAGDRVVVVIHEAVVVGLEALAK
jgi:hypothetical protein